MRKDPHNLKGIMADEKKKIPEMTDVDRAAEQSVLLFFLVMSFFITLIILTFFAVLVRYHVIGRTTALYVWGILSIIGVGILAMNSFFSLGLNEVAFIYNILTKGKRTAIGKIRIKMPGSLEEVSVVNIGITHTIKNSPGAKYDTSDDAFVTLEALMLMKPDVENLSTYNDYENSVIDEAAKAEFENLLKAYVKSREVEKILPIINEVGKIADDPFQKAYEIYRINRLAAFEQKYGVKIISAKIAKVTLDKDVVDSMNRIKAAKSHMEAAEIIQKKTGLTMAEAEEREFQLHAQNLELLKVNLGEGKGGGGNKRRRK